MICELDGVKDRQHLDTVKNGHGETFLEFIRDIWVGFPTLTKLYDSCVVPVMGYCSSVWGLRTFGCLIRYTIELYGISLAYTTSHQPQQCGGIWAGWTQPQDIIHVLLTFGIDLYKCQTRELLRKSFYGTVTNKEQIGLQRSVVYFRVCRKTIYFMTGLQ